MSFMLDISWREDFLMMKCVCAGVAVAGEPIRAFSVHLRGRMCDVGRKAGNDAVGRQSVSRTQRTYPLSSLSSFNSMNTLFSGLYRKPNLLLSKKVL